MNLMEEFTLLAFDDDGRKIVDSTRLDYTLGGAILLELALAERIEVVDKKVVVRDPSATGDELLDQSLTRIATDTKSRKPGHWVQKFAKGTRQRVLDDLVAAGVLRAEEGKFLIIFPQTRYPSAAGGEPVVETEARARMRAAIEGTGEADPRTSALCALVAASDTSRKVFADLDRKLVKRRLKEISEGAWAAAAVKRAIEEVFAAVAASGAAVAAAAAAGS
ncbi:GOLPH3/VPS74 family protein [Actinoplanes utahensis]|uniref:GPP34 family phosphoprotein n=1 Tax=Actinoplanes utahensis TaxID=1869 RepID=A0A0A6UMN1_ACTUT|nr:GPP34 family phosphoprotein [Actinoplanes utahensis]KHD76298.1 hypothetical protein MB27_17975 [Actinoplanes utahensis]GIF30936.1 hypothetical protein Aut01nite_39220 [Actinoplanes utahensis]